MNKKVFAILVISVPLATVRAQSSVDTTFYTEALKNSISKYHQFVNEHINLYNGYEYIKPEQTTEKEHPFFKSDDWTSGTIVYNDELFEGIPLLYDITGDKLVTEHYQNGNEVELIREKVKLFSLAQHRFERIKNEDVANSLPQSGFYEILYDGTTKAIALRQKKRLQTTSFNQIDITFPHKDRYFIFKNDRFFQVGGKASILKLLADQKSSLKQFINSQKLNFTRAPETSLARLVAFYDALKLGNR